MSPERVCPMVTSRMAGGSRNIVFADLAVGWVKGRNEFMLEGRNLFNQKEFDYATNSSLIDSSTRSPLRPASILLKMKVSIL